MADDTRVAEEPFRLEPFRPQRADKLPPCNANCPSGTPIRDWIATIAQSGDDADSRHQAYVRAWQELVAHNPLPATMGRICPHPCEMDCNRGDKDGAVAVNALERFLGDWAIDKQLELPVLDSEPKPESVAVIGAGPAGLSFAYQLCRRGYAVTLYDRHPLAGGMLRYGIPDYRLPPAVLDAELERIFSLGVEFVGNVRIGVDLELKQLQNSYQVLFLGLGAQLGRRLDLAGDVGANVWTGTEFLDLHNRGNTPALGGHAVVVGGGNTAIDAARVARRQGAEVMILYRRCREDMPAIDSEVDAALEEGVEMVFHASPLDLVRSETGEMTAVRVQRMRAGQIDATGRAAAVPVPGDTCTVLASAMISAVSQQTDWTGLETLEPDAGFLPFDRAEAAGLAAGGDITGLDLASHAIGQGSLSAARMHARLRDLPLPANATAAVTPVIQSDHYRDCTRVSVPVAAVAQRLAAPQAELCDTLSEQEFLREVSRCYSCGLCNGCQQCWMFCGGQGFTRLDSPRPGHYFAFATDTCSGCGKCIELCPTGFLARSTATER